LTALRCKFNRTGRGGQVSSPPGAGVDVEAEDSVCRKGLFVECEFLDNTGAGFVADTGDSEDIRLVRCRFLGTTNYSVWPNKPKIVFEECEIYGSAVRTYGSHDPSRATQFLRCHFEDRAYLPGRPVHGGAVIEANGDNVLFDGCTVIANASRALWIDGPGSREIIRDTVVIHRATSAGGAPLGPNDFQSLIRGSSLENVEFREDFPAGATGPWYVTVHDLGAPFRADRGDRRGRHLAALPARAPLRERGARFGHVPGGRPDLQPQPRRGWHGGVDLRGGRLSGKLEDVRPDLRLTRFAPLPPRCGFRLASHGLPIGISLRVTWPVGWEL
jgi:hypothetical protein